MKSTVSINAQFTNVPAFFLISEGYLHVYNFPNSLNMHILGIGILTFIIAFKSHDC